MSRSLGIKLTDAQVERLKDAARRQDRTPAETAAVFVEEALRMEQFPLIDFRNTPAGRRAYIKASRLSVWMTVYFLRRSYGGDAAAMAAALEHPTVEIKQAAAYAAAYPAEIEEAIAEHQSMTLEKLKESIPNLQVFEAR